MRSHAIWLVLALVACDDTTPSADPATSPITSAGPPATGTAADSAPTAAPSGATPVSAATARAQVDPAAPAKPVADPPADATADPKTDPSAALTAAPSAEATAAPAAPATLLGAISRARKVKVVERRDREVEAEIAEADPIAALFAAIGMTQDLEGGCPSCVPAVRFAFSDAFGTRLGSIGWRCGADETLAVVHDALANECKRITVADPAALGRLVEELFAAKTP